MKSLTSKKLRSIILETLSSLNEISKDNVEELKAKSNKDKVKALQTHVGVEADGKWGDNTDKAWRQYLKGNE